MMMVAKGITSLEGISNFTALKALNLWQNFGLVDLDISQLVHLEDLNILSVNISSLDTSKNPELRRLLTGDAGPNYTLDLSNNPKLEDLHVSTEVDVSNNPLLKKLVFGEFANIQNVDVGNNPELMYLYLGFSNPEVTEIDLSNNQKLIELRLGQTSISSLDLSNNAMLEKVGGLENAYTTSHIRYVNLKSGNNQALQEINLSSTSCVQVDDVAYAEGQTDWNIGSGSFSLDCNATLTM